jgi:hypothetical protein
LILLSKIANGPGREHLNNTFLIKDRQLKPEGHNRHEDPNAFIKFIQQQDAELERRIQLEIGAPAHGLHKIQT